MHEIIKKAIEQNDLNTLAKLVKEQVDFFEGDLYITAALKGSPAAVSLFLQALPFSKLSAEERTEKLRFILDSFIRSYGRNKSLAKTEDFLQVIHDIILALGDVNSTPSTNDYCLTPLYYAASFADLPMFAMLIQMGADIHSGEKPMKRVLDDGMWDGPDDNILMAACKRWGEHNRSTVDLKARLILVDWLLHNGVDINYINKRGVDDHENGYTALMCAIWGNSCPNKDFDTNSDPEARPYPELIRLLIKKGANIDTNSTLGTALIQATLREAPDAIRVLLDNGACPTIKGGEGIGAQYVPACVAKTAFEIAKESESNEVRLLLAAEQALRDAGFTPRTVCQQAIDAYIKNCHEAHSFEGYCRDDLLTLIRKILPSSISELHIKSRIIKSIEPVILNYLLKNGLQVANISKINPHEVVSHEVDPHYDDAIRQCIFFAAEPLLKRWLGPDWRNHFKDTGFTPPVVSQQNFDSHLEYCNAPHPFVGYSEASLLTLIKKILPLTISGWGFSPYPYILDNLLNKGLQVANNNKTNDTELDPGYDYAIRDSMVTRHLQENHNIIPELSALISSYLEKEGSPYLMTQPDQTNNINYIAPLRFSTNNNTSSSDETVTQYQQTLPDQTNNINYIAPLRFSTNSNTSSSDEKVPQNQQTLIQYGQALSDSTLLSIAMSESLGSLVDEESKSMQPSDHEMVASTSTDPTVASTIVATNHVGLTLQQQRENQIAAIAKRSAITPQENNNLESPKYKS